jgi:dephospho-CoA kinase
VKIGNDKPDSEPQRPYTVGLTGGIGSGKSTIGSVFAGHGIAVVDTDAIAHEISAPGGQAIQALREMFGPDAIAADGSMDRDWMRRRVFEDASERTRLESILHPMIRQITNDRMMAATSAYVVLDVPLLVESGNWSRRCDRVLVVDCQVETQISRVMARNQLSRERIESIIAAQATREQRLAAADDVIDNNGDLNTARAQADRLHEQYLALAASQTGGRL